MKAVKRKLKNESGASIIISLMFLLVVMMVGTVCLVAAFNNSGRATHAKDDLQRYYAVQSAVNLIQEDLKKEKAEFIFTEIADTNPVSYKIEIPDENKNGGGTVKYGKFVYDLMTSTLKDAATPTYIPSGIQGIPGELDLTVSGTQEDKYNNSLKVEGSYTLGSKIWSNTGNTKDLDFTVTVSVWFDDNGTKTYATTLTFPAYIRRVNIYNADETVTTKYYVTWDDPRSGRWEAE